jgi:hypothetical protein
MGAAELVVLLAIGGACYVALTPLRRALERRMLRRRGRKSGRVIPLIRSSDGVYRPPTRRTGGDER